MRQRKLQARMALRPVAWAAAMLAAASVQAFPIDAPEDWAIRWDNTVNASTKYRLGNADPRLSSSATAANMNAGDQNFQKKGIVSERVELLSEFDAVWKQNFGLRVSAATWYDNKYRGTTQATDFTGQVPNNEFPAETRKLAGHKAEILDAFVFGGVRFDNGMKLTGRLGQHALLWGESVFFGDNGIARAQGPLDIDKLLASPGVQVREFIRPVPQVSGQLQISPELSLGAYYQFRWREDRMPPPGSYLSPFNALWGSDMAMALGPTLALAHGNDVKPSNNGQFGLQLKWRMADTDLGVYAARYHEKGGQIYADMANHTYYWKFPEAVRVIGASASRNIGDVNFAGELSVRDNMPLRNDQIFYGFFPGQAAPQFATGRTAHANVSWLAIMGRNFIAQESALIGEIAWNRVLKKNDPNNTLDPALTRDASSIRLIYTPTYRQVLSGLDLNVPIGIGYNLTGFSSITPWNAKGTGDFSIGLEGTYLTNWNIALKYTKYIGKAIPSFDFSTNANGKGNPFADRDYVSLSVRRTF